MLLASDLRFLNPLQLRIATYGDATRFSSRQKATIARMVEKYLGSERAAELRGQMRLFE